MIIPEVPRTVTCRDATSARLRPRVLRWSVGSGPILTLNAGSSTIKFAVFDAPGLEARSVAGALDRTASRGATLAWRTGADAGRLDVPDEKVVSVLDRIGNTSAGSIPYALATAADEGRMQPGDLVLLMGFGAGMTAASAVIRWNPR